MAVRYSGLPPATKDRKTEGSEQPQNVVRCSGVSLTSGGRLRSWKVAQAVKSAILGGIGWKLVRKTGYGASKGCGLMDFEVAFLTIWAAGGGLAACSRNGEASAYPGQGIATTR